MKPKAKEPKKMMSGAAILVEALKREGVKDIFGIPGGVTLPLFDVLYDSGIRKILTRHEQGAAHMADGYARSTGKVGVCIVTSGPGATNLVTGLATAYLDSIPVVAITGQVATHLIGNDAFQEADATGIMRPVTKHNYMVKDVQDLSRVVQEAFYIARSGRPGPVHIDVPVDVQKAVTEFTWESNIQIRSYKPKVKGHPRQIQKAAELINKADKPLLYVGGGAVTSHAQKELLVLAEKADIPVTHTLMANGAFPSTHANYVGILGMHGRYSANIAMQKCDVLISCGARFDDRVTGKLTAFSQQSKKIHIDVDPANIGKTVSVDVPVVGDLKNVLKDLIKQVSSKKRASWKKELQALEDKHPFVIKKKGNGLQPQLLIQELHTQTKGRAILATGVGQHQMWAMQWYPSNLENGFLTSGGLGTMGYGFPAAIGAKVANPDKQVICIEGDGSFQMMLCELGTVAHEGISMVLVVINNFSLGMVRQWQDMFYNKRYSVTNLTESGSYIYKNDAAEVGKTKYIPDYMKLVEAYGATGVRITKNEEIEGAVETALKAKGLFIIEAMISPDEKVFPMIPANAGLDEIIVDMA